MGIDMTGLAILQTEMSRSVMAAAAGRDDIRISRRMSLVTLKTDFTMGSTLVLNGKNCIAVTLAAVFLTQYRPCFLLAFIGIFSPSRRGKIYCGEEQYSIKICPFKKELHCHPVQYKFECKSKKEADLGRIIIQIEF